LSDYEEVYILQNNASRQDSIYQLFCQCMFLHGKVNTANTVATALRTASVRTWSQLISSVQAGEVRDAEAGMA
jgi:hypothetical protein